FDHPQLSAENRAGFTKLRDNGCIVIDDLVLARLGAPARRHALGGAKIRRTVWDAVQRATIWPGANFLGRSFRLLRPRMTHDDADGVQLWSEFFQAVEVRVG